MPPSMLARFLTVSFVIIASNPICAASDEELVVVRSHAACKDTTVVEQFDKFEKDDDDQNYKKLYIDKGATRECIFLTPGEILREGAALNGPWVCVKELYAAAECYWTPAAAVKRR
jgi:hypothetical protein